MQNDLGMRMKGLIRGKGFTQKEVACRSGVSETSISRCVNGKRRIRPAGIERVASVLNTSADWLVSGKD